MKFDGAKYDGIWSTQDGAYRAWSILELMGHRRLGGHVEETTIAGADFLRIDVYGQKPAEDGAADEPLLTQFYSAGAVYCLTPATEDTARRLGEASRPRPSTRLSLPEPEGWGGDQGPDDDGDPDDDPIPY